MRGSEFEYLHESAMSLYMYIPEKPEAKEDKARLLYILNEMIDYGNWKKHEFEPIAKEIRDIREKYMPFLKQWAKAKDAEQTSSLEAA
ncbi:MAG: hypothetical protein LBU73_00835 [Helicobacteraceae bacterium]|jgi:hypothetical protein|nr:hypothetical protein [Helicobacteraceae bacterium]